MNIRHIATGATLALFCLGASAQNGEFFPFHEIMAMKMIDKNNDGMVSKKEFMDMMTMAWEMNAKKMGVKGDAMTAEQFKQFMSYFGERR